MQTASEAISASSTPLIAAMRMLYHAVHGLSPSGALRKKKSPERVRAWMAGSDSEPDEESLPTEWEPELTLTDLLAPLTLEEFER